jgi:hypothetical protein
VDRLSRVRSDPGREVGLIGLDGFSRVKLG